MVEEFLDRVLTWLRVDLRRASPTPAPWRVLVATVVAVGGSLAADIALVALGKHVFPSVRHYGHFQFSDYAKLTVIGVLIACVGWPIVARVTTTPRPFFLRLAIAVTLVLFLPDAYIYFVQGQPAKGVFVLIWLHVAIAIVTYQALVRIAPAGAPHKAAPA